MQLPLFLDDRTAILSEIQRRLLACSGSFRRSRERGAVETLVHGMIGWKTRTELTDEVVADLYETFGDWQALADADTADIETRILRVTFADVKAPRLKAALTEIIQRTGTLSLRHLRNMSVPDALAWLESLPGIGRKISAGTLNASSLGMRALVIDTHHLRILKRVGLVAKSADFTSAYDEVMPLLPVSWSSADVDEHHILLKQLGRTVCRYDIPQCRHCPLSALCETGRTCLPTSTHLRPTKRGR